MVLGTLEDTPYTDPQRHRHSRRPTLHTDANNGPRSLRRRQSVGVSEDRRHVRAPLGGGLARQAAALRAQLEEYAWISPKIMVGVCAHRAREQRSGRQRERSAPCAASSTGARTLRAGVVPRRVAGSAGNAGGSNVLASATHLRLDEKRSHAPLLVQNQARLEGVGFLDLVDLVERDDPRGVVDVDGRGRRGRRLRSCVHTPPHKQAKKIRLRQSAASRFCEHQGERQAGMWRVAVGVAGQWVMGWVPRKCWRRPLT